MNWRRLMIIAVFLVGCGGGMPRPKTGIDSATELLQLARKSQESITSLRIVGTLDHVGSQRVRGQAYIFSLPPDRLRIDVLSPFGTTLSVFSARDGGFRLADHKSGRYFQGEASPCNLARFVGVPLPIEDLVQVLMGGTPLIDGAASLTWDTDGYWVVTIHSDAHHQVLRFSHQHPNGSPRLVSTQLFHKDASIIKVAYAEWQSVEGTAIPFEIQIDMPKDNARVYIVYEQVEVNVSFPSDAFDGGGPSGVVVEEMKCESPSYMRNAIETMEQ